MLFDGGVQGLEKFLFRQRIVQRRAGFSEC